MKNNYILGLNIYHGDSSACIIKNGEIRFAIEEERENRIKHWAGLPLKAINACLQNEKIEFSDINYVAINTNPYSNIIHKFKYVITNPQNINIYFKRFLIKKKKRSFEKIIQKKFNVNKKINIKFYDHHLCHHASSFFPSGLQNSLIISTDGFGDFASTTAGVGFKNNIKINHKVLFPHSLGIFYQTLTQLLGFKRYGDEYKVMGLSAYGSNKFHNEMNSLIHFKKNTFKLNLNFFRHHNTNIDMKWDNEAPKFDNLYNNKIKDLFQYDFENNDINQNHMDLAHSIQKKYEEVIIKYIKFFKNFYEAENLSLSGGCAMNSLANRRIIKDLGFRKIYIPPAPGDAGGAIGAALLCLNEFGKLEYNKSFSTPYTGREFSNEFIETTIRKKLKEHKINDEKFSFEIIHNEKELIKTISQKIYENKIVGWFQNRMEWGPRALGNRSILANPCNPKMKDIINSKIKLREKFRPFAPSIIKEKVNEWFESDIDVPYMSIVMNIKSEMKEKIPAVTHVDGTGRLQTVNHETNPLFYNLINSFYKISNVPIILNTSFNENEPIVNTPDEAIDCFLRTKMDILTIGNIVIQRTK